MRAVLCASLCNCRHSLRAEDEEALVEVALEHMRHNHPDASVEEKRIRETIATRSYDIEYVVVYEGGYRPDAEFVVEPYCGPHLEVEESYSPGAWKWSSPKLDFRLTAFCELLRPCTGC